MLKYFKLSMKVIILIQCCKSFFKESRRITTLRANNKSRQNPGIANVNEARGENYEEMLVTYYTNYIFSKFLFFL